MRSREANQSSRGKNTHTDSDTQREKGKMKEITVLYAGMGIGHLVPMVAFAKLLLHHGFAVTIVTIDPPPTSSSSAKVISQFSSANPSISFHILPTIPIPPEVSHNPINQMFNILRCSNANFLDFLESKSKTASVRCVVLDMFCTAALEVTNKMCIPCYFYFASGASFLAASLHVPVLDKILSASFKDMGRTPIDFPGLPPVPATDLPQTVHDRTSESYKTRIENWPRYMEADGIILNTFEQLEPKALKALRARQWSPKMSPIYCVGPLITQAGDNGSEAQHECLTWLDAQPKQSVVFLCFGSMGAFSLGQIKEIAIGLENSGQRFLWVVKIQNDPTKLLESQSEHELDTVLPEGFLDRTKDRGMVVKSWTPQAQVLQHESVGGFVSHCGWNSTLEAVTYGVPMICWPLYAEQRLNKVILSEEIKVGIVMDGYDEGFVRAEEVENKVRWLMESNEGLALKERMSAMKQKAAEALQNDGSSSQAFVQLLKDFEEMNKGN